MISTVIIVVSVMCIATGILFGLKNIGVDAAGGSALKGISVSGPAWLVLICVGLGGLLFERWVGESNPSKSRTTVTQPTDPPFFFDEEEEFPGGFTFGDNQALDQLWLNCEQGDWASCDELYLQSEIGSDYEWFGATCGAIFVDAVGFCLPESQLEEQP